jgi:hypothetical protein
MSIEKHISKIFEEIKSTKNSIKEVTSSKTKSPINEAAFISPLDSTSVSSPFGPRWGTLPMEWLRLQQFSTMIVVGQ